MRGRSGISSWRGLACALVMLMPASAAADSAAGQPPLPDAIALYGDGIRFDVLRNGLPIGEHRVRFEEGQELVVDSETDLRVGLLFLTAYRFVYHSRERWQDGRLMRITADVDDNGDAFRLDAAAGSAGLLVKATDLSYVAPAGLLPTNHWNAAVLHESQVLNTLTGRVNNVKIEPAGRERVVTERGDVDATRYLYRGDLQAEVWYDDAGRWVKLRFAGRDGSTIEYACRICQGGVVRSAGR